MPSHKSHRLIDELVLKKQFPEVHWFKDRPYLYYGPHHRKVRHDHATNLMIGALLGSDAFISAEMHDLVDFSYSALKKARRKKK